MKNRWVLTTKYHIDDTVEREKARLVVKGFTHVYGANYDETYSSVSSYVTLRTFLSIVVGSRRCAAGRWLEEELGRHGALRQGRRRRSEMLGAGLHRGPARRQQQHSDAEGVRGPLWLGFRQKELKELLEAAFEQREISPVVKYLGLEIVDAYAKLTFDNEEAQEREEEEYRQKGTGFVSTVSGGAARPRPYYVPLLQQVLGSPPSPGPPPPFLSPPPVQSQSQLQPASPLPGPSPYSGPTRGLTERREPESRSASPVRTVRAGRVSRPRPPPVPGTHSMTLRPSTAPHRVPLLSPPASSLPACPDPAFDSLRAACPDVMRFLATAVADPLFESTAASALVTELVDFAAACRLDYATTLVAKSASAFVCPPSVGGECALCSDVLEDRQEEFEYLAASVPHLVSMLIAPKGDLDAPDIPTPRSYAEAIEGPYSSQWQAAMDAEMASWKSTGTYVGEVPPPGANILSGMWIFRTFSPSPKMTTLRVLLHVTAQRDYELHLLDFSTAFLHGSLHEEIWLRRPPGFTGSFPADTQWSLRGPVYGLRQAPREWHDMLKTTLSALGFAPSTSDPSLFLCTNTTLPPFYVLVYVDDLVFATTDTEALAHVLQRFGFTYSSPQSIPLPTGHSLSTPPSDESVEPSGPYPELVGCLITSSMGLVLGGRARVVLIGHADASWVDNLATQRSSQGYTFSLGSGSVSWWSTRSSSVLSSSCEAEIYVGGMAAEELCWLTYLLTDLGEVPRSPSVLYVDNKAMLALCQEHRLEHRMKHIALRYFLARELQ
ncbi:unnamed protein product [Closterium sp. NIES-53]